MSFVLQTVAGILRDATPMHQSAGGSDERTGDCGCRKHPSRCCHKADSYTARSTSFECINDDLND